MLLADQNHWDQINSGTHVEGTYQNPFIPSIGASSSRSASPAGSTSSAGSAAAVRPTYLRGRRTLPIAASPGTTVPDGCLFAPGPLISFDEELFSHIASTIVDGDTVDDLETECDSSGRAALNILFKRADKISTASGTNLEVSMGAMVKKGCDPSITSFNGWKSTYSGLNKSQHKHSIKSSAMLARIYAQVVKA